MLSQVPSFFPRLIDLKNGWLHFSFIGLLVVTAIAWVLISVATGSDFILFALIGREGMVDQGIEMCKRRKLISVVEKRATTADAIATHGRLKPVPDTKRIELPAISRLRS